MGVYDAAKAERKEAGQQVYFNRYGMRSQEVDYTKKHVLGLGDSVINGGVQTEQDSLATSIFFYRNRCSNAEYICWKLGT